MFIGMQKSYAHGHHDINYLQSHDSDVNVAVTEVMETLDSENHEVTLLSKVASKAKKNSTTFAILAIVNRNYCNYCDCGWFGHSSDCGGGSSCYLHSGINCYNSPYIP